MKPKELLLKNINEYLLEDFSELGFKFLKSTQSFKRIIGGFVQEIYFCSSKYNHDDYCEFWSGWSVHSKQYLKWHQQEFGVKPTSNCIWSSNDWNIEGWKIPSSERTCLRNDAEDETRIGEFKSACVEIGIPALEQFSNLQACIDRDLNNKAAIKSRVIKLMFMLGQVGPALEQTRLFISQIESGELHDQFMELQKLKDILSQYGQR